LLNISHSTTPKAHTSLAVLHACCVSTSGAAQRTGMLLKSEALLSLLLLLLLAWLRPKSAT
jgi:hypothetical protein